MISGHGANIRALNDEDVTRWQLDLKGFTVNRCIAVEGEDLGTCLAAVVGVPNNGNPVLLWSDADGSGTPIKHEITFAHAVVSVMRGVHPQLGL